MFFIGKHKPGAQRIDLCVNPVFFGHNNCGHSWQNKEGDGHHSVSEKAKIKFQFPNRHTIGSYTTF